MRIEALVDPRLSVELVPSTCWYSNVRTNVSRQQWELCKKFVRTRSGDRCEVCKGRGRQQGWGWNVECHEVWEYVERGTAPLIVRTQRLTGLVALCPRCHEVKHIGRADAVGNLPRALEHLMVVNGWSDDEAELYIQVAFEVWHERSNYDWTLDVSYLDEIWAAYKV